MSEVEYIVEDSYKVRLMGEGQNLAVLNCPGLGKAETLYLASVLHHALISGAGAQVRALAERDVARFCAPELVDA